MQTTISSEPLTATARDFTSEVIPLPRQVSYGRAFFQDPKVQERIRSGSHGNVSVTFDEAGFVRGINDYQTRTTATTTGLTSIQKLPTVVELGQQPLTIAQLCGQGTTDSPTVRYIRETSFTNAATTVAEAASKPEAAFATAEVDAPVRKVAVTARITDELLQDQPAAVSYIDGRLRFMVGTTEEQEILSGSGSGTHVAGILNTSGIQTQAKGGDTQIDCIFKAATKVYTGAFIPATAVAVHPLDWQTIRLTKDSNNLPYGPGPFYAPYGNGPYAVVDKLWNLNVVVTSNITQGTALVGNFYQGCMIFRKQGVTIEVSNSDQDNFIKNLVTIRAEERFALACFLPLAFCQCTGL